jgi:hypothetical protein
MEMLEIGFGWHVILHLALLCHSGHGPVIFVAGIFKNSPNLHQSDHK